jgi:hypothetical protein
MNRRTTWFCLSVACVNLLACAAVAKDQISPPTPGPCGTASTTGAQDVTFTSTISYNSANPLTLWLTSIVVIGNNGIVGSKTDAITSNPGTGGVNVVDPKLTIKVQPGTYTVQAVLVEQPLQPAGQPTVWSKSCTYTINPNP